MPEIAPESSVADIVDAVGLSALARHLGHRHPSTVSSWKERGSIPVRYWPDVIEAARIVAGKVITTEVLARACAKRAPAEASAA